VNIHTPIIISASRRTDLPAFHTDWLMNRLKIGSCDWINPFNHQKVSISFQKTKVFVFWSKYPQPLLSYLPEFDKQGFYYYFQYTLNDYEQEKWEPNIPPLGKRILTFQDLSGRIGKEKIIWRFDPLMLTDKIGVEELLQKVENIGNQLKGYTEKLVFSFADITQYRKVEHNLKQKKINYREFTIQSMSEFARGLQDLNKNWHYTLATCAETIDLKHYGIDHNCCIDPELMKRIFAQDDDFVYYLTYNRFPEKNGLLFTNKDKNEVQRKDRGQRKACGCVLSKDIGMYNTCPYLCVYCYANTSQNIVGMNYKLTNKNNASIV